MFRVQEKRRFRRYWRHEAIQYQFNDPNHFGGSLSCDVSEGGLRMHFPDFVPVGTEVALTMPLTPERILDCRAQVVWVEKMPEVDRYQLGLEFIPGTLPSNWLVDLANA